jgi:serine/threonine-protein kinase
VYALGVVVYQMLTARLPWEGSTLAELATRRESEDPLPPTSYDSSVPETLSTAVLRALEGEVDHRYSTAKEFSAALRAGVAGREPPAASDEEPTRALLAGGAATAATRAMDSPDIATPVSPEPAYRPPRRAAAPAPAPVQARRPSGGSRFLRALGVLFLVGILAAAIAIAVLVATDAGQGTDIGNAISDEINEQIDKLQELISDNTQQ